MSQYDDREGLDLFMNYLPKGAELYCYGLWREHNFNFKISKPRKSKFGDFRYNKGQTTISVNNDLNPYNFLITYLHEVAHLLTYKKYKDLVAPHGLEWKSSFQMLMKPIFEADILPQDISLALGNYMRNVKASSCSDHQLMQTLSTYDARRVKSYLSDLNEGEFFLFRNKKYQKVKKRRTRSLCIEIATSRKYLISEIAEVVPYKD